VCDWLPPELLLGDFDGDWERYLEALYEKFKADFVSQKPSFREKRWAVKRHPVTKGKEATFWHIISDGKDEDDRLTDMRRCEKLPWVRAIINEDGSEKILTWEQKRGQETRILLALPDFSYVVILADRTDYVMLWTAFPVKKESQRERYRKEYEASKS
jgi:hypothetical protein